MWFFPSRCPQLRHLSRRWLKVFMEKTFGTIEGVVPNFGVVGVRHHFGDQARLIS